jgi:hypothetical protein
MRPGTKVRLWSPKFTNQPDVEPPALLKLAGAISVFSAAASLVYAVFSTLNFAGPVGAEAAYVAVLHFVLPVCIFYTINVNSPLSRFAIGLYVITLGAATVLGKGFLGSLPISQTSRVVAAVAGVALVLLWLSVSPKMRFYYAVIAGRPIPEELRARTDELRGGGNLSPRASTVLEWLVDRMETAVLLGFIAVVFYAWWSTG